MHKHAIHYIVPKTVYVIGLTEKNMQRPAPVFPCFPTANALSLGNYKGHATQNIMSTTHRCRVNIRNLSALIRIGIHPHERTPQRILVNAVVEGDYPPRPSSIDECFNYDPIHQLVTEEWTRRGHTSLLETYVVELLEFIFRLDDRVTYAKVSVCKPDIFPQAEAVGAEAEWTRADFERIAGKTTAKQTV